MKILAKKTSNKNNDEYYNRLPLPSQVKRLGKFLAKNLTGVYKVEEPPNQYIIYSTILYQVKPEVRKAMKKYQKEFQGIEETVYEMNIYYNITTYAQYIRVNVIQLDENEQTLGYLRLEPKELMSLPFCKQKILEYTKKVIEKKYSDYEVLI
jgi:hypothetical protein